MNFVKTAATKSVGSSSLRKHLHKLLAGPRQLRSHRVVHASEVVKTSFCPREYALLDETNKKPGTEFLTAATKLVHAQGHGLEKFIRTTMHDSIVGDWDCTVCGTRQKFSKKPSSCPKCMATKFEYVEVRAISATSEISCGLDALWDEGTSKHRLIELKTLDKDKFKTLVAPYAEHRSRTALYLQCIAESDDPALKRVWTDEAIVLYISKGGWGDKEIEMAEWGTGEYPYFSPFKEFRVGIKDADTAPYVERALLVKGYRELGLMPKGVCTTAFCTRAKSCQVVQACFSGQYPALKQGG